MWTHNAAIRPQIDIEESKRTDTLDLSHLLDGLRQVRREERHGAARHDVAEGGVVLA